MKTFCPISTSLRQYHCCFMCRRTETFSLERNHQLMFKAVSMNTLEFLELQVGLQHLCRIKELASLVVSLYGVDGCCLVLPSPLCWFSYCVSSLLCYHKTYRKAKLLLLFLHYVSRFPGVSWNRSLLVNARIAGEKVLSIFGQCI